MTDQLFFDFVTDTRFEADCVGRRVTDDHVHVSQSTFLNGLSTTFADSPRAASSPPAPTPPRASDPSIPRAGTATEPRRRDSHCGERKAAPGKNETPPKTPSGCATSELRPPPRRSPSGSPGAELDAVLSAIETLPLDEPADRHYGAIRSELERMGRPIGHNDLLIAAHARALGATLVTNNVTEFSRVTDLEIEDWRRQPRRLA